MIIYSDPIKKDILIKEGNHYKMHIGGWYAGGFIAKSDTAALQIFKRVMKGEKAMQNYHIVADTETEKYSIIRMIRAAGAVLTAVSGYGTGYYIQLQATPEQSAEIDKMLEMEAAYAGN